MFINEAEILVRSGKGGDGMKGGDVILEVRPSLNTLQAFRRVSRYLANNGKNGGPNNMSGKSADDLVIAIPPGTVIHDAATGELIGDMTKASERLTICNGGRGGRGNQHFATSRNQAPHTRSEERRV